MMGKKMISNFLAITIEPPSIPFILGYALGIVVARWIWR